MSGLTFAAIREQLEKNKLVTLVTPGPGSYLWHVIGFMTSGDMALECDDTKRICSYRENEITDWTIALPKPEPRKALAYVDESGEVRNFLDIETLPVYVQSKFTRAPGFDREEVLA